jgi:hypothetical protein
MSPKPVQTQVMSPKPVQRVEPQAMSPKEAMSPKATPPKPTQMQVISPRSPINNKPMNPQTQNKEPKLIEETKSEPIETFGQQQQATPTQEQQSHNHFFATDFLTGISEIRFNSTYPKQLIEFDTIDPLQLISKMQQQS